MARRSPPNSAGFAGHEMARTLVFGSAAGDRVAIKERVVSQLRLLAEAARTGPEAGGILIGRRLLDCGDLVVDAATEPFPTDTRSRHRFTRRPQGHQQVLDSAWTESHGSVNYLGEWHTHPVAGVVPSPADQSNWRSLASQFPSTLLVFLIVGAGGALGCWSVGERWTEED